MAMRSSRAFGNLLIHKSYGQPGNHFKPRENETFRGGERMPPLKSMALPVSIRCSTCSHDMLQGSAVTAVCRLAHAKTCSGDPIVSYFFCCTKCRESIMIKEDAEKPDHVILKYGATKIENPEILGEIVDEHHDSNLKTSGHHRKTHDEGHLDQETSTSDLKRQKVTIVLPSNSTDVSTLSDSSGTTLSDSSSTEVCSD